LRGPLRVVFVITRGSAVLPDLAWNKGTYDGRGASSPRFLDELAQIPAERMHVALHFVPDTREAYTGSLRAIERAAIVMTELHTHEVARLDHVLNPVPVHACIEGPATQAAHGSVHDIHLTRIEQVEQWLAPSPLPAGTVAAAVTHG